MPAVGFGTYLIPNEEASVAVSRALRAGYRHVDTAEAYGNEEGVGEGIREAAVALGLEREDVFVTTKLWPGNPAWGDPAKGSDATTAALEASLERLGVDHVDLYLIHAPFAGEGRLDQWRALVDLRDRGRARAVGVSNFSIDHIREIEEAGLPLPDANQIELHPWSQKPELVAYLHQKGIQPIAYSSLVPLSSWRAVEGQDSAKTDGMMAEGTSEDSPFKRLAAKYAVSEAQILLRWAIQRGFAVLPKSTNPERVRLNIDLFSFELDTPDMDALAQMDRGDGVAWAVGDPTRAE
jgi:2,5-diketo-D-gluconate reductase A